ncbi:bifunctional nicotinamide-nucleotide adenylyltransferase/Nudix hydroxylase [Lysobacter sp. BMK333-48F3]|uniref:bifunctional nicotinamide-nucleotide adenylyltransferase/Nudix hydroxylase n=1 Tax=Lysobacter sp. BMK333-48F3 TaxID=2867962 RepID=UPI001C8C8483|nr:bifunctional nicotinamide-nucleotide adenylyltransferase/Nudix hydroxylase [Lysobacter sp. BMK333-48F3]MBX9402157.1 bifunctional nicotinamide-nucleotide adenylyltransferase/Nudix hydroxylase [Lysobacter sp. BMK333-48F3]
MAHEYDYLVFIGRFEPFHNGHAAVARHALGKAKKVVFLVGSADTPRTVKNPFTVAERAVMIQSAFADAAERLIVRPLRDHLYNESQWIAAVQRTVAEAVRQDGADADARIGLIGMDKDASSYYLREFPQWPLVDVTHTATLSATELRRYLFEANQLDSHGGLMLIRANVPAPVFDMLEAFRKNSPAFRQLVAEYQFLEQYRAAWADAPYPPTFVTTDAVVVHSGHVLLVRRRAEPGKGLWALPGGFVGQHEGLLDACLRELREETRLKLPLPVLKGSLKGQRVFDHPERSARGRTITHAYHFEFAAGDLPPVRGGDDADKARWIPVSEALEMSPQLYEDHLHILEYFLGHG